MMKRFEKKDERVEESKNHMVRANAQQDIDSEILENMQKRKEEKEALKKMLGNLKQLQNLNKQHKRKTKN